MESWHELSIQDQRLAIGSMTGALENVAQLLADVRSQTNYNYVRTHNNIRKFSSTSMNSRTNFHFPFEQLFPFMFTICLHWNTACVSRWC